MRECVWLYAGVDSSSTCKLDELGKGSVQYKPGRLLIPATKPDTASPTTHYLGEGERGASPRMNGENSLVSLRKGSETRVPAFVLVRRAPRRLEHGGSRQARPVGQFRFPTKATHTHTHGGTDAGTSC